jgi:hypothetical protein
MFVPDSPIQQLAKRYVYQGTDVVADWDLGLVRARPYLDIARSGDPNTVDSGPEILAANNTSTKNSEISINPII